MRLWQYRFIELAAHVGAWSKDPSTRVGAVIVRPDRTIASLGYNGFPRGVADTPELLEERAQKYPRMVHAEMNAILTAHERLTGYTLYVHPLLPCPTCAGAIIQSGISQVVAFKTPAPEHWEEALVISKEMLAQAGVELVLL